MQPSIHQWIAYAPRTGRNRTNSAQVLEPLCGNRATATHGLVPEYRPVAAALKLDANVLELFICVKIQLVFVAVIC